MIPEQSARRRGWFPLLSVLFSLTWSVAPTCVGQEPEFQQGDRFEAQLLELQKRIEVLESEKLALEEDLDLSRRTDERMSELEERLKTEAEEAAAAEKKKKEEDAKKGKKWFEKYTIRGYAQFRINEVVSDYGPAASQAVGDQSVSPNQSFLIRRARLILQGDVSEHLSLYFQPDFASNVPGSPDANQFAQIVTSMATCIWMMNECTGFASVNPKCRMAGEPAVEFESSAIGSK